MDNNILKSIEEGQLKKRPAVRVGDTVKLYMKIKEGEKIRTQIFEGVVIGIKGVGLNTCLTVRKLSYGIGVEKIVSLHSPILEKIVVVKKGEVKRAKLYFLRGRVGRRALKVNNTMAEEEVEPVVEEEVKPEEVPVEEKVEA